MSVIPYMPLWVGDYLADTQDLTTEEHGAYLLLIMTYWQRGTPFPADPVRLAMIARVPNERWTSVERTLRRMFNVEGDTWVHERVEAELKRARSRSQHASKAGKPSAESRKSNVEQNECSTTQTQRGMIKHRIKEIRERRRLSQERLGTLVGRDKWFVYRLETRGQKLDLETAQKVAAALECTVSELMGLEGVMCGNRREAVEPAREDLSEKQERVIERIVRKIKRSQKVAS